ncbi:MAG: type IV pilus biogenesis/stability protein PilW [Gammaproteobacteria bacterium]|nr:type IV pilus biogenesis/stability protein PilW [Gammaproteobacteria bacterium]
MKIKTFTIVLWCAFSLPGCSLLSSDKPAEKPADIYLQLGIRYMDIDKLELAKQNLQKAVEKDPNNARAHSALAFLNEKINHFDEAKQHYEAAVTIAPDDISVQNNYGRFLCERRQFERGLSYLQQAAGNLLNDRSWITLTNSARCHLGMGQRPQAINLLKQALQLNEQYPAALLEMQEISYQTGDYRAAEEYLQRYLGESKHTSETLWIGIQTEEALGNMSLANEYRNLLLEKFPNSNEAKQVSGIR